MKVNSSVLTFSRCCIAVNINPLFYVFLVRVLVSVIVLRGCEKRDHWCVVFRAFNTVGDFTQTAVLKVIILLFLDRLDFQQSSPLHFCSEILRSACFGVCLILLGTCGNQRDTIGTLILLTHNK